MQIAQIVPRLAPAIDGVGDYTLLLAKQLRATHNIETVFVVCDPAWEPAKNGNSRPLTTLDGFPIHQLKAQNAGELLQVLTQPGMPTTALLQFVNYGYQKRGCPIWLLSGLSDWLGKKTQEKAQPAFTGTRRLVTMFHELFAFGPPWSSSFWTSPVQKWIAKSLARISEHCFTNLNVNARTLARLTSQDAGKFTVLPVFSNVGEAEGLPAWNERQSRMVVFGSAGWRRKAYGDCKSELEKACSALKLNEIVDIGAPVDIQGFDLRISKRGILSAAETSREMLSARAGFFAYPVNCLGKSGIFAAYAAHGLVPVTFDGNNMDNGDGLILGEHYLSVAKASGRNPPEFEEVGARAHKWYLTHNIDSQASGYKRWLLRES